MGTAAKASVSLGHLSMVVLAALGLATAACGSAANQTGEPTPGKAQTTQSSPAATAKQLWVASDSDVATGRPRDVNVVRVSPDGKTVVVGGSGPTVAYDATSGARLWQASEDGMPSGAAWLALSVDGSAVYVTGMVAPESADAAYRTVAYALGSGKRLWTATLERVGAGTQGVASVAATAEAVIVNGVTSDGRGKAGMVTVAYDASTGARRWISRVDASRGGALGWFPNGSRSLAVSPDGTAAYETVGSTAGDVSSILTVAYDVATGHRSWIARHEAPGRGNAMGLAVAVSPDGSTLVTTGMSESARTRTDSVTIGYDASTGKQRWIRTYNGPANQNEGTGLVAFAPTGATVFIAGTSEGATPEHEDMIVLAYDTASGAPIWAVRWDGPAGHDDNASDLAAALDGSSVVVVGRTVPEPMKDQYATVALRPETGAVLWFGTYGITTSTEGNLACGATSVAIARDRTVFVTGSAAAGTATVAYEPPR